MAPGQARTSRTASYCVFVGLVLGPALVAAAPKFQGVGETSVGYTDNVRTTPDSTTLSGTPRTSGAFITLSPGLNATLETPRSTQRFAFRYEYDLFFAQSNASVSSNQLDYRGVFDLSQRVTLTVGSSASETNRYAAVALAAPGSGVVTALPAGAGAFVQAGAEEALSVDLAPGWRGWQGLNFVVAAPILGTVAPQTIEPAARVGVEKLFLRDAVGAEARVDYTTVRNGVRSDGTRLGVQNLLVSGAVAQWRHDWSRSLTSSAEAGAARIQRLDNGRGFWAPTAAAMLAYATVTGDAQLSYAHSVSTNALLGQTLLADDIRLRGALPLTAHDELLLAVTAGYERGSIIDENANRAAHVNIAMGDVLLGWQVTQALQLALRYQHITQTSSAATPPLPLSFVQNNVLVGAVLKFPPDRDLPRPYRAPLRVDRSDELRDGVTPGSALQRETAAPSNPR